MEGKPTVASLAAQLNTHLVDCGKQGETTNRRLGRIEDRMFAGLAVAVIQLLVLVGFLFVKAYG